MRLLFALSSFLLTSCATMKAECATHGGQPWLEVRSAHFLVRTNLESQAARVATMDLERSLAVIRRFYPGKDQTSSPIETVVFRNTMQLQDITGANFIDGAMFRDWHGGLLLVGSLAYVIGSTTERTVLLHELTHHVTSSVLGRQPRWLAEGLAQYMETATIDETGGVRAGGPGDAYRQVRRSNPLPFDELWAWDTDDSENRALTIDRYSTSWLFAHYFYNHAEQPFRAFLAALGAGAEPRAAFTKAFTGVDLKSLDAEVQRYADKGRYTALLFDLPPLPDQLEERALPDAEAHAIFARIAASTARGREARAGSEVAAALALDPRVALALELEVLFERDNPKRLELAERFTRSHPEHASAWRLYGRALALNQPDAAKVIAALRRAHQLGGEDPGVLEDLASALLVTGGSVEEALALAIKAAGLSPHDPVQHATLAAALAAMGKCDEAARTLAHASELISEKATAQFRAALLETPRQFLEQCRQPAGL